MLDVEILIGLYLCGWVVVGLALYAAGRRFADSGSPAPHTLWVSVLGGAVWPVVVIGFVELSSVIVYSKVQNKPGPGVGIFA